MATFQISANNSTSSRYSKKLADSCVWTYEKGPLVIRLDLESNNYIMDDYDDY